MEDRCGMGGVGTKPKPLLSTEVSCLVRVQEDRFTQCSFICTLVLLVFVYVDYYDYTF